MAVTPSSPGPYAPAKAVLEVVTRHRSRGLPSPVNGEVLGRAGISDSLIQRTLLALETLDLIDDNGSPTPTFEGLRLAPEGEYQQRMADWLNSAYADVLRYVDPQSADETAVRDAFRSYSPVGQQPRMVSLFLGLYAAAGIGREKPAATRQPRKGRAAAAANGSNASSAAKRNATPAGASTLTPPPPSPPPSPPMSDAALEYKLVDLMKDEGIGESERSAIWTLVQYLTGKARKKPADPE